MMRTLTTGLLTVLLVSLVDCGGTESPTDAGEPQAPIPTTITLSSTTLVFSSLGEMQQVTATVADQNGAAMGGASVTWSSSNVQIALVSSSGLVTAVANGSATITATSGTASASASASVAQAAALITLSSDSVNFVLLGDTLTITASVLDGGGHVIEGAAVIWGSSDESVITVSGSGLVTAVANGAATITAAAGGVQRTAAATVNLAFSDEVFSLIPSGTFQMGSASFGPVHTVNITQPFYMQNTEVTQRQWLAVMGSNPSVFSNCGDECPVDNVSWDMIQTFLAILNAREPGKNYRMPTEAEWEYAARAGTTGNYGGTGNLDDMGWYSGNSLNNTHRIAGKQPNDWGLYDMHGNVFEWVQDWYGAYGPTEVDDPTGPATGLRRVQRGGSVGWGAGLARSDYRRPFDPRFNNGNMGFRLARTP